MNKEIGVWMDVRHYNQKTQEKTKEEVDNFLLSVKGRIEEELKNNNFIKFNPDKIERKFIKTTEDEFNNITENKYKDVFDKLYREYKATMREVSNFCFNSLAFEFEKKREGGIDILEMEIAYLKN